MHRPCSIRFALLTLPFLGSAAPSPAQEKPAPLAEPLFALYALDDMYNKPLLRLRQDRWLVQELAEMSGFLAERRLLFDRLRRHYEKHKDLDKAVPDLYRAYERELDLWKDLK